MNNSQLKQNQIVNVNKSQYKMIEQIAEGNYLLKITINRGLRHCVQGLKDIRWQAFCNEENDTLIAQQAFLIGILN